MLYRCGGFGCISLQIVFFNDTMKEKNLESMDVEKKKPQEINESETA